MLQRSPTSKFGRQDSTERGTRALRHPPHRGKNRVVGRAARGRKRRARAVLGWAQGSRQGR
eukprot:scaffold242465_cov33-Tisochrysis_lutea.AAC.1